MRAEIRTGELLIEMKERGERDRLVEFQGPGHLEGRVEVAGPLVCTENPIRVADVTESPKLAE